MSPRTKAAYNRLDSAGQELLDAALDLSLALMSDESSSEEVPTANELAVKDEYDLLAKLAEDCETARQQSFCQLWLELLQQEAARNLRNSNPRV